jgi:hypothetical protein
MSKKIRVLVFPCGSENAIEINRALRYSVHVDLFGASSIDDHGRFRFEQYIGGLPNINDKEFDNAFASLIARLKIDMVFATHDTVMEYLASRAQAMGFFLVNGDPVTTAIVRRKSLTYQFFTDCNWIPNVFDSVNDIKDWPAIIKPDLGQGGQGVTVVPDISEATLALSNIENPVIVDYLPGDELTVDCFTDRNRNLVWVGPRTRERVKAGITMRSNLLDVNSEVNGIASEINSRLTFRGPWFFQLKRDRLNKYKLLEISCRIAGSMVAQRARGVNLPLMAVQDFLGRSLVTTPNLRINVIDRNISTCANFDFEFDTVFVDLDDTLIIEGFAVPQVMAFLYQSIREGKQIKLITRHESDISLTLRKSRVASELFDEIIHLRNGESKADYVTENSIFIDNHFPERLDVATKRGVPVLDVDTLEFFLR